MNVTDRTLPTATVGAISEYLVCVDLLSMGYDAYRAVSPACPCDLVAIKNGKTLRIEVTTAYIGPTGGILSCKKPSERFDVIAFVLKKTNEIVYQPNID